LNVPVGQLDASELPPEYRSGVDPDGEGQIFEDVAKRGMAKDYSNSKGVLPFKEFLSDPKEGHPVLIFQGEVRPKARVDKEKTILLIHELSIAQKP
jgi:hypothetical protein